MQPATLGVSDATLRDFVQLPMQLLALQAAWLCGSVCNRLRNHCATAYATFGPKYSDSELQFHLPIKGKNRMSDLVKTGSKYSDQQRMEVAILYAISGNAKKVAKATGVPRTTIVGWKKQEWWQDAVTSIQSEKADEHRAKYSELVDKAQQVALEKLPEANAAQANLIACQATDKIRLHDGMPTEITGNMDNRALAEQCKELSRTMRDHGVVSTQGKADKGDPEDEGGPE